MNDHDFEELLAGAREAVAHAKGKKVAGAVVHQGIDVAKIRTQLELSQRAFADRFGFSVATVRQWEQGRRQPRGPAQTLLITLAHEPDAVSRALAMHARA